MSSLTEEKRSLFWRGSDGSCSPRLEGPSTSAHEMTIKRPLLVIHQTFQEPKTY